MGLFWREYLEFVVAGVEKGDNGPLLPLLFYFLFVLTTY